jgi:hypothetical protein
VLIAHAWLDPAAIDRSVRTPGAVSSTMTGMFDESSVLPLPSCPSPFHPQQTPGPVIPTAFVTPQANCPPADTSANPLVEMESPPQVAA